MNAERLLAHFERISEAPDAIARLRRFILDLAVRGKLVEQDPEDEPAEELLRLISMEKGLHLKNSRIARGFQVEVSTSLESPFDLPASWEWIPATYPASSISDADKKVQTNEVLEAGAYPVVDQGKVFIRGYCNDPTKVIKVEEPLILFGDHTRETKFIDFDFVVGADGVKLLKPIGILPEYYFLSLRWLPLDSRGYGRHFKLLKSSVIPLAPLAEQHRIVAKVDELMALCDQLEASRQQREQHRERLVAASLQRLNQPSEDPASFRNDARFALQVLPSLTTTPAQIKQLRQTILNLAVRGKLVEQDPEDEDKMARSRLVEFADKSYSLIPVSWLRVPLACLLDEDTRNGYSRKPDDAEDGFPILRISAGTARTDGLVDEGEFKLISGIDEDLASQYSVKRGDLLACRFNGNKAYVGRLSLFMGHSGKKFIYPDKLIRVRLSEWLAEPSFFRWISSSDLVREEVEERCATTVGNWGISAGKLKTCMFPLPPLAEQHRIVAKVDELMALCDQLEQQLNQADQQRRRLLEALLAEALTEPEKALASAGSA